MEAIVAHENNFLSKKLKFECLQVPSILQSPLNIFTQLNLTISFKVGSTIISIFTDGNWRHSTLVPCSKWESWFMADIMTINSFSSKNKYEKGILKNDIQFSEPDKILEECIFSHVSGWKAWRIYCVLEVVWIVWF